MKRKWIKRSDIIILSMTILWFITAIWMMGMVTIQVIRGDYNASIGEVGMFVGGAFTGGVVAWLIKNMSESNTKNKLNPGYLTQENNEDDFNI